MTDKLSIYNGALLKTGSRRLAALTETQESRRVLDDIWDNGGVRRVLEMGFWKHAMRTVRADYSASVEPSFGYQYAFDKPDDLVRLFSLCTDEYFKWPLYNYQDEANYWFADYNPLYIRYVSNDTDRGMDMSLWPGSFTELVEYYFAMHAIKRLTDAKADYDLLVRDFRQAKMRAKAEDALKDPVSFPPDTGWQRSRAGVLRHRPPYR